MDHKLFLENFGLDAVNTLPKSTVRHFGKSEIGDWY